MARIMTLEKDLRILRNGGFAVELPIKQYNKDAIGNYIKDMKEIMRNNGGIGIAAPQIDCTLRMIVVNWSVLYDNNRDLYNPNLMTIINPVIEYNWKEGINNGVEACLSVPGRIGLVSRANCVTVHGFDIDNNPIYISNVNNFASRVFQHEVDHLNGILYFDHILGGYDTLQTIDRF